MIGVPTSTVSPSFTSSSVTVPAYGVGSPPSDLLVSTSTKMSLIFTSSPTATRQVTMSASTSPSPGSGSRNVRNAMRGLPSVGQRAIDHVEHPVKIRKIFLLDAARRIRYVKAGDAQHGGFRGVEALFSDPRGELGNQHQT